MKNIPEQIYLQIGDIENSDFNELSEVTWCKDKVHNTDIEYVRKKSPWISVKEQLPDENENIIIMCEHGAIFNGTYMSGDWFCMDGYIHDTFKRNPIYSSMVTIPPLWEPIAWMPIPKFNE